MAAPCQLVPPIRPWIRTFCCLPSLVMVWSELVAFGLDEWSSWPSMPVLGLLLATTLAVAELLLVRRFRNQLCASVVGVVFLQTPRHCVPLQAVVAPPLQARLRCGPFCRSPRVAPERVGGDMCPCV